RTRFLVQLARPLRVTFHRAFDLAADSFRALEEVISLGIERILTSGRAKTALEGLSLITRLVQVAAGRTIIMPASGITPQNVRTILATSDAAEIHAGSAVSIKKEYPQSGLFLTPRNVVDPRKVRALLEVT
ncbi:MAG: copper homeostasis protein CutC, partial [bacterium]